MLVKFAFTPIEGMTSWKFVGVALFTVIVASGLGAADMPDEPDFRLAAIKGNVTLAG